MCGIAGIISHQPSRRSREHILLMNRALQHRGPDGEGFWSDNEMIALGHRRLAIIDLTPAAAQPMHYMNRYTIVYNGEIYNYKELKEDLLKQGYTFQSQSDTEVILAAYDCYKERCTGYFDGMFAFAIWDKNEQTLFAARDRFGEKPFYYSAEVGCFTFASEMKAFWAIGTPKTADMKMMLNYLALGYVQNPAEKSQTFFQNIFSLPPAHYLKLDASQYKLYITAYFDVDKQTTKKYDESDAIRTLDQLLQQSVKLRLRSDVRTGSSLSGGLDSSTLSYYIREAKGANIRQHTCFSAVFPGYEKDESAFIQTVCEALQMHCITTTPTADELLNNFNRMAYHQEEPFPSSSIFAQYKIFERAAKNNVKVLIDGQGADEIFAGYHKYLHWYLQEVISRHKFGKYKKERQLIARNKIQVRWDLRNIIAAFLPSHVAIALEKAEYNRIRNHPFITKELKDCAKGRDWEGVHKPIITKLNDILYFNTMRNGLEELLRFADRNSMSHGIEVRLPFLQPDIVNFAFSLPSAFKIQNGFTKWILRKTMENKLPDSIVWRTDKVGYEPPQKIWMNDARVQDFIHESKKSLVQEKLLKPTVLQKAIKPMDAHQADNFDWRYLCAAHMLHTP
ncbi:MAG: asparagine synthase (glutamine-hydrolyzing) [Ferruginibacter sp.]|nr:asparagine synthase (glutamine-hydrolyzing) [Ferruginibacter sp.]